MDLTKLDKNLKESTSLKYDDIEFYDARCGKFDFYGAYNPLEKTDYYYRIPKENAEKANILYLAKCTSGIRVRFKTNSRYVAIRADIEGAFAGYNKSVLGNSAFDMYVKDEMGWKYGGVFYPCADYDKCYESAVEFEDSRTRDVVINFPTYDMVKSLYIGLQKNASLENGGKYSIEKPVVFYGSSITQGAAASRPGCTYFSILERRFDMNYTNIGFSGNCKAQPEVISYMKNLDMTAFVCCYDYNAADIDYLKATHHTVYDAIREVHKDIPIIFTGKPDFYSASYKTMRENEKRRAIVFETYKNALASGDNNVYFIDNSQYYNFKDWDCCSGDGCHPNDLGFMRIANAMENTLKIVL